MGHLKLAYFGTFQAMLGNEPITNFRSVKVQALLIFLSLTSDQSHVREVLATFFWPDETETAAKRNLRQSLFRLRKVLGDTGSDKKPYLLVTRTTVQFNADSDHTLDVSDFLAYLENDRLEPAINTYEGDLLPGFTCDSLPFEEWLRQERERFHRLALDALFELTARKLTRADYNAARDLAQRQLTIEPWREEAYRQLMRALALLGERSAALAQYEACRVVLDQELNIEPSPETKALADRIRNLMLERDARSEPTATLERRRLTTPFVGRKGEHGMLVRAYQQACSGGAQVITLIGEAGIGKTRLAQHFMDWAATQGADILRGQAFETSGRLSYQPLTQAMRQRLEAENAPDDLLSDLWLTQLTRILPELRDRYPDLPQPTIEEGTARQHLFEAIARLGQALAERAPLILFIDDWHWADAASLDVLHYAALRWLEEHVPILILLNVRQGALAESADMQDWLTRLKHDVAYVQLRLTPLSAAETKELIWTLLNPDESNSKTPGAVAETPSPFARFSGTLFEETDGQPFFLVETLKALVEAGLIRPKPDSTAWQVDWSKFDEHASRPGSTDLPGVQEIIHSWLERISSPAGELLAAAAVLGQQASFDYLCRVTGLDEIQALTALDELLSRQLLLEAGKEALVPGHELTYNFSHQKLREVVYAEAGAARRRILHRRAFETLQAKSVSAAELAHHALHAGMWLETIRYSLVAGKEAMDLFAVKVAVAHFETAWQVAETIDWPEAVSGADRRDLYADLGRAYELTESWQQAEDIYQAMITHAKTIRDAAIECQALNRLATVYINGFDDLPRAIDLLGQARAVAEQSGDQRGLAETEWNLSVAVRKDKEIHAARHHGERALAIARQLGHPELLARCLNSLAYVHCYLRQWDMVQLRADEARDLYRSAGNRILEADCQRLAGWSQMFTGQPLDSLATLQDTFAFSQQIENLWGEAECAYRLAHTQLEMGRYGQAISLAEQAVQQARKVGVPTMVLLALSTWGTVQRTVMNLEDAREKLLAFVPESIERTSAGFGDWILAELCALHALAGDWDTAYDFARQSLQARRKESLPPISLTSWYEIETLLRKGRDDLAQAEVEKLSKAVGNNKRYQLLLYRSQAVLAHWYGDSTKAMIHLQDGVGLAREIGLPGEEWSILATLGKLYEVNGRQSEAKRAWNASATIILDLAETIDEERFRETFLSAEPVRSILEMNEAND